MISCSQCRNVFRVIGEALNSSADTVEMLRRTSTTMVEEFELKACHFRLLSRDQRILEDIASYGLSEKFLGKGPVDAERSVTEALRGKVVMVNDCSSDPRIQYPLEHVEEGIASLLTVPLEARGQVIGVMRLATGTKRDFAPEEVEFFKVTALFCTTAIIHSMFHDIVEHVTQVIRSSLELDQVLESIARVIAEDLRTKGCTIQLLDRDNNLEVRASFGLSQEYLATISAKPDKAAAAALKGECVAVLDARNDPRIPQVAEVIRERFSSLLYVPLADRQSTLGLLAVYTHNPYEFSDDEKYLLTSLAEQCALAIRNAQMYAALKRRYDSTVNEFQQWFEHYYSYPPNKQPQAE